MSPALQLHVKLDELREKEWEALVVMQQKQIALLESVVAESSATCREES